MIDEFVDPHYSYCLFFPIYAKSNGMPDTRNLLVIWRYILLFFRTTQLLVLFLRAEYCTFSSPSQTARS